VTVHVIGAGLAGLASAVRLVEAGCRVRIYEAAGHAGGRCRSFHDRDLDRHIDNGNHLLMRGNTAAFAYLDAIGSRESFVAAGPASFPFLDLATGERWSVRPNSGRIPWWMLVPARRVAGTRAADYLPALGLARARADKTVAACFRTDSAVYKRLWEPLTVAALNTAAEEGAARLLWPVVAETFLRGEAYCRPYVARDGLSPALVDPAVALLARRGSPVRFNERLKSIAVTGGRVTALTFARGEIAVGAEDCVVLAVPNAIGCQLLPDLIPALPARAIVNAHYRLPEPVRLPDGSPFLGLVGGTAQWLFARGDVVSVTVSAADELSRETNPRIAEILWRDVARALNLAEAAVPGYRIINERRATIAQTPAVDRKRLPVTTPIPNLLLAGDWTATGLPATIESAIRSGHQAARHFLADRKPV